MSAITLYSFQQNPTTRITVYRDSNDPTFIDYFSNFGTGGSPMPPDGTIVSVVCIGFDQYTYKVRASGPPYATYSKVINSPYCGYTPPACDIREINFKKTDETESGANNGTVTYFASSSFPVIIYTLINSDTSQSWSNNTGYFTDVAPGDYSVSAVDNNACGVYEYFTIEPFDSTKTHFKYRLHFESILDPNTTFELQMYDILNNYSAFDYPIDIKGTEKPVVTKTADQNEAKETAIITRQITMNLVYDGLTFTPDEFLKAPQQSWRIDLIRNGDIIDFRGWLIPDESASEYMDAPYVLSLTATDGLASLKGNFWGNGSGGVGYGINQIQQYGLTQWCKLVKQCLDQLGYEYNYSVLLSSLRFNSIYNRDLWLNMGAWSDILYSEDAVVINTYDALSLLLQAVKLCIFQHNGIFHFINWNDLFYINNNLTAAEYHKAFYMFASDFSNIAATGLDVPQPDQQLIGYNTGFNPVKPPQTISYDKPYNIEEDVSFDTLALLYEDPSFEIGAVQDQVPILWQHGGVGNPSHLDFGYENYDPLDPANPTSGAFQGNWEFRFNWQFLDSPDANIQYTNWYELITPIPIDQPGFFVNVAFAWRPTAVAGYVANTLPKYALIYIDGTTGHKFTYEDTTVAVATRWYQFSDAPSATNRVVGFTPAQYTGGDYTSWQMYSLQTQLVLPESGIGTLNFRFYPPLYITNPPTPGTIPPDGTRLLADVDALNLTLVSANPAAINQTGEKHNATAITGVPQANIKTLSPQLFTFPANRRAAGNIWNGFQFGTGVVANLWNFALKAVDPPDRLPATITKALARNYSRQMRRFEGNIESPYISYYSAFFIKYYDGEVFMPFSIEGDLRNGIWHIVLCEIDDSDAQFQYQYTPVFERAARANS